MHALCNANAVQVQRELNSTPFHDQIGVAGDCSGLCGAVQGVLLY